MQHCQSTEEVEVEKVRGAWRESKTSRQILSIADAISSRQIEECTF